MYFKLKKGILENITKTAIKKAGSIRRLAKNLEIKRNTIFNYSHEKIIASKINVDKLTKFIGIKVKKTEIVELLKDNWRQIKGGKNRVKIAREKGTFESQLKKARDISGKGIKKWHRIMKKENPEKYHMIQYERFKKIGGYKYLTKKREKVRNTLEKETADFLFNKKVPYQYEPLVKSNNKYFFPDFLINNNLIIECTAWRGSDKAIKLKEKINNLRKNYKVYVLIPIKLRSYYKLIKENLIFNMNDIKIIPK